MRFNVSSAIILFIEKKMELEDIIINAPILYALQNAEIVEDRNNIRRYHLIQDDPFELSDKKFVQLFRLNKAAVRYLIGIVEPYMNPQTRISAISPTTKIIIVIFLLQ